MACANRPGLACAAALAVACGLGVSSPASAGSLDGAFIMSTPANEAPSYESDYAAEARLHGLDNSPEADARPGEYYFLKGAHAFRKHDYAFAIQMYQVAASWAFKPAEYNLGVMYAQGQGVEVDLPRAMAWMALAAERNEPHYVEAREAVYASITPAQFEQANAIWRELKTTYGDAVALRRAKARWAEVKSHMTGSRVGSVGNLTVGMPNGRLSDPGSSKPGSEGMAKALAAAGVAVTGTTASTTAETLGGGGVDGATAYQQLRESDNPYDPKFDRSKMGTALVGQPQTVANGKAKDADAKPQDDAQDANRQQP
jgi:hypothetical protein